MQWLGVCVLIAFTPSSSRSAVCLDIRIMVDLFMTTALLQERLIELRQQGLADADLALQLSTLFCSALMFSSAHPVARPRHENETRYFTRQLIVRFPLLIPSRHGRVSELFLTFTNRLATTTACRRNPVRVAVIALEAKTEPQIYFYASQVVAMLLQPACLEVGPRYSEMRTLEFYQGQIMLFPRNEELWVRTQTRGVQLLEMTLSNAALSSASNQTDGEVALFSRHDQVDPRIRALVNAVNAERIAGFPSGELFLDSVERALAAALVDSYPTKHSTAPTSRRFRLSILRCLARQQSAQSWILRNEPSPLEFALLIRSK
jgi:hypothetical protein